MILDAKAPEKPAGIVVDTGTGKRIPFVRKFDTDTGEYEAFCPTADGKDILLDEHWKPILLKGKAIGKLVMVPMDQASLLGAEPPQKKQSPIQPLSPEQKLDGLEQYKKVFFEVWSYKGQSKRCTNDRWDNYLSTLRDNSFLDAFVIRRRTMPVTQH